MTLNIDPELRPYLDLLPAPVETDVATARANAEAFVAQAVGAADVSGLRIDDCTVRVPDGPDVAVRVYAPEIADGPTPGVLYIHGGGYVVGSIDMEHPQAASLARGVGATVVSLEYRLAPEHPFPAGLEDCYAALSWLHDEAGALGVDRDRIAIVGNSAGGGLAAGLALLARDRGGPPISFQFLGIPMLDDRLETPSMRRFVDTPMWTRGQAERSWRMYLGELAGGDVPPYAAAARATDLSGLPPAYVSTMENDPLRDEGLLYGMRLLEAGVSTEIHAWPGTWHGSRGFPSAVSQRDLDEVLVVLRRALASPAKDHAL